MKLVYTLDEVIHDSPSIYLAGPTIRISGNKDNNIADKYRWRKDAVDILKKKKFNGIIYIPEYKDNIKPNDWTYNKQLDWELKAMNAADVILFWIPRDMEFTPALTTNIEFGEWMNSGKIIVGAPNNAVKNDYIKRRCEMLGIKWFCSLRLIIGSAIKNMKVQDKKEWFTSDTHFGQERTLELSKRPFQNVNIMDKEIITRWNSVVSNKDDVYHLGDFGNPDVIKQLNGNKIYILPGNYDDENVLKKLKKDSRVKIIDQNHKYKIKNKEFSLVHEPDSGNGENCFYLFGHIHKLQMIKKNGVNVGTDCHNFYPIDNEIIMFYRDAIEKHYDNNVFLKIIGA